MKPITYKTYFLLGFPHFGHIGGRVVKRWEYAPSGVELKHALDDAAKDYDAFVLVSPAGAMLPGNYTDPAYDPYAYHGG